MILLKSALCEVNIYMNLNEKLKARRIELGLSLEQVGNMVGVGKSTVRKWETGDIKNMGRSQIAKYAEALKYHQ